MHWYNLQAQIQVCLVGHTIYRVTVLRPVALMQRLGCDPESLLATQRRLVEKKKMMNVTTRTLYGGKHRYLLNCTPLPFAPLFIPPPKGGTVIWPMNNKKSIGNHRRRRH